MLKEEEEKQKNGGKTQPSPAEIKRKMERNAAIKD